ncbi:MAG: class I SAM-dependent methyltransferase [Acetobacteraceae bacterium]|nr:class I SAM-dependent methyltransferase [Acetobacteraceae bacterium]
MTATDRLAAHYRHGSLEQAIDAGLRKAGRDPGRLVAADLAGVDEFHVGGAQATRELVGQLGITAGMRLLDIGSGIGGPARHLAGLGCHVTGVDVMAEYVAVARSLSARLGMGEQVTFVQGDAAAMDLPAAGFDGATLLHVGMNIADKAGLAAAVYRALKPGGFFAVYDVMRVGAGEIRYPVPWSSEAEGNFVAAPGVYRAALEGAGFVVFAERDRAAFAQAFFAAMRARMAEAGGPPALGLHLVMGARAGEKIANLAAAIAGGVLAPVEMLARKGAGK